MDWETRKFEKQLSWETRKFIVQVVVGAAACLATGVALANYVNSRPPAPPPPAPPPQIIYIQPMAPTPVAPLARP